ncbi:unnamed protein product [Schistosoma curassoni]|uniref:Uncharacterized protein n=1 Tax=Schistosoma curassoni TaxID=6186 RepID=A0A183KDB1_9TREM|nr:unnamed protein product [Schistosoma curassoni]
MARPSSVENKHTPGVALNKKKQEQKDHSVFQAHCKDIEYWIVQIVLSDVKSLVYELDALKALNSLAKMPLDMLVIHDEFLKSCCCIESNQQYWKQGNPCIYDSIFSKEDDFNPKLHRSDRRHDKLIGLEINQEEKSKDIPTLSSSIYGHRLNKNIENNDRKHVRIMLVESEFYRRNGINLL